MTHYIDTTKTRWETDIEGNLVEIAILTQEELLDLMTGKALPLYRSEFIEQEDGSTHEWRVNQQTLVWFNLTTNETEMAYKQRVLAAELAEESAAIAQAHEEEIALKIFNIAVNDFAETYERPPTDDEEDFYWENGCFPDCSHELVDDEEEEEDA